MTINGQAPPSGLTSFENEACEAIDVIDDYVPSSLAIAQNDIQDIKKYFERPRLALAGNVTFGLRENLAAVNLLADHAALIQWFPQWKSRLSGAYGIRFKLVFRLQVAATPFHQGILSMAFQYGSNTVGQPYQRGFETASQTNLPHVRLDMSETTMVELKVPFLYQHEFMHVSPDDSQLTHNYGAFYLNTLLTPFAVTGLNVATYRVYVHLEDIELYGARNNDFTTITLQSGMSAVGSVIADEVKNNHLLSRTFAGAARISRFIGKSVPSLAAIAGPVAWASDTAAGIAKYFGYSRPLIQDPTLRTNAAAFSSETHVDVPMAGFTCGPMQSNTLAVSPDFGGTNIDEMSLSYLFKQWSQVCVGNISSTNTHAQVIYAAPVSPHAFWFRSPASAPYCNKTYPRSSADLISQTGNSFLPSTLMYFSSFFRLWRGTMRFRFTFAKTKLHAGRYMVSYTPTITERTDPSGISTVRGPEVSSTLVQPYGYSMIIDLKDGNVFEFEVPYIVETPYLGFHSSSGGLTMVCMDPLMGSSTTSNTIPFLVEIQGGDDYEVADFAGNMFMNMPSLATIYEQSGEIVQQSGSVVSATSSPAQLTIGERIMSVKQIIQIPWWTRFGLSAGQTNDTFLAPWHTWMPSSVLYANMAIPLPASVTWDGGSSHAGAISKCFVFAKGGSDNHIYCSTSASNRVSIVVDQMARENTTSTTVFPTMLARCTRGGIPKVIDMGISPYVHVRSPAYQFVSKVLTCAYDAVGFKSSGTNGSLQIVKDARAHFDHATIRNTGSDSVEIFIARAAADDAALSHYIGPPPVAIPNSTSTNLLEASFL